MAKNGSGYGFITVFFAAFIAHSCGEDAGRQAAQRKARGEIETLESQNRQLKQDIATMKQGIGCRQAEDPPHIAR